MHVFSNELNSQSNDSVRWKHVLQHNERDKPRKCHIESSYEPMHRCYQNTRFEDCNKAYQDQIFLHLKHSFPIKGLESSLLTDLATRTLLKHSDGSLQLAKLPRGLQQWNKLLLMVDSYPISHIRYLH
jgi:hypothetical protein